MVRKRKTDEEMVSPGPRLTRQRRHLDDEGDLETTTMEKPSKSSRTPKATASRAATATRRKKHTANEDVTIATRPRRVRVLKSSSDSDVENKAEEPKKKATNHRELHSGENYPTRSRAKKVGNATIQDSPNSEDEDEADVTLVESKKHTRKKRVLTAADNTLIECPTPLRNLVKLTRSQAKSVPTKIDPIPDTPASKIETSGGESSPVDLKSKKINSSSILRRIVETPRKVSPRRQSNSSINPADDTITPKSSPMLVNLTPHRSSKTPKKSPMNIGSPKTHSQSPLRLSKTPRKLPVAVESPATSDKSSVSLSNQSPTALKSSSAKLPDPFVVLTDFKKEASPITDETLDIINSSENSENFVSIAKVKLRKQGKKLLAESPLGSQKESPERSSDLTIDEICAEISITNPRKRSPSKKTTGTLGSKIIKSPSKNISVSGTPAKKRSALATPKRTPANIKPVNISNPESPKRPKSTNKKRSPITSLGTPLRPLPDSGEDLSKAGGSSIGISSKKIKFLLDVGNSSLESTPRSRTRRSLHLTPDFVKFSSDSTSSPIEIQKKTNLVLPSPLSFGDLGDEKMIKDESLELLNASNFLNVSDDILAESKKAPADGTYELSKEDVAEKKPEVLEETEVDNATYELAEPKTPSLQKKKSRKRSLSNVEPEKCTPDAKKRCRVRFASPTYAESKDSPAQGNARKSLPTVNTPVKQRIGGRLSRASPGLDNSRRRSRSLTKIEQKTPSTRNNVKRRSTSVSDLSNKTPKLSQSTQNSVNRLSKPRQSCSSEVKLDVKLPVPRKAPNFALIHQKKFAELESLVDAKKRVAKRHEDFTASTSARVLQSSSSVVPEEQQTLNEPAPTDTQNGVFNRFGFKLRKAEAMEVVTKAPAPVASRIKKLQETNRSIIKGVRTNRRFELLMKARNSK